MGPKVKYTHAYLWFPLLFLVVNHHNIENWVPSILTHNLWLILMGMRQKKKIKMADSKKGHFSTLSILNISWIGPWVSRIDWCEGHWWGSTYMVVRLPDISSKIAKKHIASSPWKLVTNYVLEWMGLNFQYYDGLQPKIRARIINEHECRCFVFISVFVQ